LQTAMIILKKTFLSRAA